MPTFGGSYSRCEAVRLQATEGIIVIEHETNLHVGIRASAAAGGNTKKALKRVMSLCL